MSRYWNEFYANRDRDNINKKISINDVKIRGVVVVKKQTTNNNNNNNTITDSIKRIFNEK